MSDIVDRAESELWEWDTYGSFWNGREVMAGLVAELKSARVEIDRLRA